MTTTYAMAYTELLELLRYLPKEEYDRIPKEKIEFYEKNKDKNYEFVFDPAKPLQEQNISRKTNGIIVMLFRDYFATEEQKEKLKTILKRNDEKLQKEASEKYNPDNLFKQRNIIETGQVEENNALIEYKESIFTKIIKFIKRIIKRK